MFPLIIFMSILLGALSSRVIRLGWPDALIIDPELLATLFVSLVFGMLVVLIRLYTMVSALMDAATPGTPGEEQEIMTHNTPST
jgi:hypothetical protein